MSTPLETLFAQLCTEFPPESQTTRAAPISVPAVVARWLEAGPVVFTGADRTALDALCRQIDVRRRVSESYQEGWRRTEPELAAEPVVVAGLVAVLLANAAGVGAPGPTGELNDGWGLKCTNSALKALDLLGSNDEPGSGHTGTLRGLALATLDRVRARPAV